jgi:hypothetical protein
MRAGRRSGVLGLLEPKPDGQMDNEVGVLAVFFFQVLSVLLRLEFRVTSRGMFHAILGPIAG